MADRFEVGRALGGMLAGFEPLIDRALGVAGSRQMMRKEFGSALDDIREIPFQCGRYASVPLLSPSAQQDVVGGVLHQRMLEEVGGMWRGPAAKQQSCISELIQRGFQLSPVTLCHRPYQFIVKFTPEHRADLG